MLKDYLQLRTLGVVLLGKFNPAIIQPYWLAKKGLIKEQEAKETKIGLVHPQLTRYNLDWVFLEITENRFVFNSSKEPFFSPMRDLIEGIFTCLPETPITAAGINHFLHFTIPNEDQYFKIGDKLAPLSNWADILESPKMKELQIVQEKRSDKHKGSYTIKIEPSVQVPRFGVAISINDHIALSGDSDQTGEILKSLKEIWTGSFEKSDLIIDQLGKNIDI